MKTCFVAYRLTGENPDVLDERLRVVVDSLKQAGIEAYCNWFDGHKEEVDQLTPAESLKNAFKEIDQQDGLFAMIASNEKSEGQLVEIGYAIAKGKKVIAAIQDNVNSHIYSLADKTITWTNLSDLKTKLEGISL